MIQAHYTYCALYFYYYCISSTSEPQAFDPRGRGPLLVPMEAGLCWCCCHCTRFRSTPSTCPDELNAFSLGHSTFFFSLFAQLSPTSLYDADQISPFSRKSFPSFQKCTQQNPVAISVTFNNCLFCILHCTINSLRAGLCLSHLCISMSNMVPSP